MAPIMPPVAAPMAAPLPASPPIAPAAAPTAAPRAAPPITFCPQQRCGTVIAVVSTTAQAHETRRRWRRRRTSLTCPFLLEQSCQRATRGGDVLADPGRRVARREDGQHRDDDDRGQQRKAPNGRHGPLPYLIGRLHQSQTRLPHQPGAATSGESRISLVESVRRDAARDLLRRQPQGD